MKTPRFLLIGVPLLVILLGTGYWLTRPHHFAGKEALDSASGLPSTHAASSTPGDNASGGHMRGILNQLDLTDVQRTQIAQARQTYSDHRDRHEAIMKILTPEQRAKFEQLRQASQSTNTSPPSPAPASGN